MHNGFEHYPCMKPLTGRSVLWAALLASAAVLPVSAQTQPQQPVATVAGSPVIEVADVRFSPVRLGSNTWYETDIEIQPRGGVGADNRQYINRVKVTLTLGIFSVKAAQGAKIPDTYYRASAEVAAIKSTSGRTHFRFYLPPEIVDRDQITGEQRFYLVELFVDGKALPLTKYHVPSTFKPETVEGFRNKASAEVAANDGILLPQYLTPLANAGSPPAPSFIRIENTR